MQDQELQHYGMPRRSGRYPWGSGDEPFQRSGDFLSRVQELKSKGLKETEIADALGLSTTQLRVQNSLARKERRSDLIAKVKSLKEDGLSDVKIAAQLGLKGESTVRSLLNKDSEARMNISEKTAENLRKIVDEKGMIDVGKGVERQLGISQENMRQSLEILKLEGYEVYGNRVPQATNKGQYTTLKVLAVPGTQHRDIYQYDKIYSVNDYISRDDGETFEPAFVYPSSMDSNRIQIRYADQGGDQKDGVVEIRRGVDDLSLGTSNYAQVRILVDGTHYIKGMALYSDDMPDGVDLIFNTNKTSSTPKMDVLKKIKDDPDNPFGSNIKEHGGQSYFINENGEKQLSLINKRADEGDWGDWSRELSSQFLSKQPMKLINKQISLAIDDRQSEYDEIMSLTNPTIKRALLESFANDADSASIHLKAASLPGQTYKVILPVTSLKDNEVYAPHLFDGTEVALVRYPHGGTFEIPILTVNNWNKEGRANLTTNPLDAIGINAKVAERLSGADFDGDTVMVIPITGTTKIKSTPPLKDLENFNNKIEYGPDDSKEINGVMHYYRGGVEFKPLSETATQPQMGMISNLITDMTLKGATDSELARAVKHSLVVIDANKHHLNYKQSEIDNGIAALHKKYQTQYDQFGREHQGSATLISKAKSPLRVPERKEGAFFARDTGNLLTLINEEQNLYYDDITKKVYKEKDKRTLYIDPATGKKLYHDTGRAFNKVSYKASDGSTKKATVYEKNGVLGYKNDKGLFTEVDPDRVVIQLATTRTTKIAEVEDARLLSSGTPQEEAYASYSNKMKAMGNNARKEMLIIKDIPYSPSARETYRDEVTSLDYKLNQAKLNAPKERQAQTIATSIIRAKKQERPGMTSEEEKKLSQKEIVKARAMVGAKRNEIKIDDREWAAIQAGAISPTKLKEIINNSDLDILKQRAMPRSTTSLSDQKIRRLKNMKAAGYTTTEIAQSLGISSSTINKYLKGDE